MKLTTNLNNDKDRVCDDLECQSLISKGKPIVIYKGILFFKDKYYHPNCANKLFKRAAK